MRQPQRQWAGMVLLAVLAGGAGHCGEPPRIDFRRSRSRSGRVDAGASRNDYALDLQLLGDRRRRLVARVQGRDVRGLLPDQPPGVRKGQHAFAVVPLGVSWKRVCWRAVEVEDVGPYGVTVRTEEGRSIAEVPHSLVAPPSRKRLEAGMLVRVHSGRSLPYGRVEAIRPGGVVVRTAWLGRARRVTALRREVLPIDRGLKLASPVVYRFEGTHRIGSFLALERKHRWVLGAEGVVHRLGWDRVRAVSLARRYRPGDQVRAALPISLKLVSVTRALEQHVLYEVAWAQTRRRVVSFADVVPP